MWISASRHYPPSAQGTLFPVKGFLPSVVLLSGLEGTTFLRLMSLGRDKSGKKSPSTGHIPELEPPFEERYLPWEFTTGMVLKAESSELSDIFSFTTKFPDRAEAKFPFDESIFRIDEQYSTESDTSDSEGDSSAKARERERE